MENVCKNGNVGDDVFVSLSCLESISLCIALFRTKKLTLKSWESVWRAFGASLLQLAYGIVWCFF